MGHTIDLKNYKIRTDLMLETVENNQMKGLDIKSKVVENVKVTEIYIDSLASRKLAKKIGNYITIEFDDVTDYQNQEKVKKVFSEQLKNLIDHLGLKEEDRCFVIGLGNDRSTPDALGPNAIDNVLVTNHLFMLGEVEKGFRPVAALNPGVTGQTGIETSDIILSIVKVFQPDFVLVVDALASGSVDRVNKTIQMTDTGIHPGSGVGNSRKEISKETIGIPVIAIGVPTVVDAVTIVADTINYMHKNFSYTKQNMNNPMNKLIGSGSINYLKKDVEVTEDDKKELLGMIGSLTDEEVRQLIFEVLSPIGYNLMVTPKEVDFVIEKLSSVIGNGINMALHKNVTEL